MAFHRIPSDLPPVKFISRCFRTSWCRFDPSRTRGVRVHPSHLAQVMQPSHGSAVREGIRQSRTTSYSYRSIPRHFGFAQYGAPLGTSPLGISTTLNTTLRSGRRLGISTSLTSTPLSAAQCSAAQCSAPLGTASLGCETWAGS